ncbi:ABC-three component system middle component 5 [Flavobacterium sp. UBA7680]|uniref:ABC-three component system middle component 5 n=1 Tax=Flavobacterium sp. UBA7680 TaxID=1946559 RepID=UPI0025C192FE|nr:ABC-three component system middle component 5 [Flavobacterium sp. UBA7680]
MLVYHSAFDMYHCIYRLIQLLSNLKEEYVELERLRIWDYYLAFPNEMAKIRYEKGNKDIQNLFPKKYNPYEAVIDNRIIFEKMKPYQMTAIKTLASYGLIKKDYLTENRITKIDKILFDNLLKNYEPLSDREDNIIRIMTSYFYQMPLYGEKGLKDRTNLLEYRYDA